MKFFIITWQDTVENLEVIFIMTCDAFHQFYSVVHTPNAFLFVMWYYLFLIIIFFSFNKKLISSGGEKIPMVNQNINSINLQDYS